MFSLISSDNGADHYACKSTDVKPTNGIRNGSDVYELDKVDGKHRLFMFDADTNTWIEQ